jgi:hypothetical protein
VEGNCLRDFVELSVGRDRGINAGEDQEGSGDFGDVVY